MTRLAFLGTPEVAVGFLRALHDAGHDVALVVTAPDRRRGRGTALTPTPVKLCALGLGLPVSGRVADVLYAKVELGVVVAFGTLIRADVLAQVPMVNLHFSLLPRWRGATPVERAILAGDDRTGVCLMALDEGLDTGPVYARVEAPILPRETGAELRPAPRGPRYGPSPSSAWPVVSRRWARRCPRRERPCTRPRSTGTSCGSRGDAPPSSSSGSFG